MRSPVDPGRARPTRCCCSPPASTLILAGGDDLLVVAVGFLLASIPLYGLIRITRTPLGAEAAMKTYLLGALSGILLLTGVTLLYGMSTTTSYAELPDRLADAPAGVVAAGVVAVLGGLLFKAGGAPGLFWVPDAAQGAGGAVAAFLTTVPKVGSVIAAYRLLAILPDTLAWPLLVALLAVGSMTLGNLTRLLADRPAAPAGLVHGQRGGLPVGAGRGRRTQRPRAALAAAYLAGYTVPNLSAFAVTTAFPQRRELRSYRGMGRTHPWLGAALVVALLGLGGTPPTVVFVGKLTTTAAVWDAGYAWLAVLVPSTPSSASSTTCAVSRSSTPVPRHPGHQDHAATPGRWSRTTAIATAALSLVLVIGAGALWPPSHCDSSPKHRPSPVSPREGARPPTMTNGSHFSPARAGSGRDLCPPGPTVGAWPAPRLALRQTQTPAPTPDTTEGSNTMTHHVTTMLQTYPKDVGSIDPQKLAACIEACFECAQTCTACADACLAEDMVADLVTCIRKNLDCADVCAATGNVLSRQTGNNVETTRAALEACRTACRTCAEECEQHAEMHEHCRVCAEACRRCESACADLLASLG